MNSNNSFFINVSDHWQVDTFDGSLSYPLIIGGLLNAMATAPGSTTWAANEYVALNPGTYYWQWTYNDSGCTVFVGPAGFYQPDCTPTLGTRCTGFSFGRCVGPVLSFTIPAPAPPGVDYPSPNVRDLTKRTATVLATIDPRGLDTTYYWQFGPTTNYGVTSETRSVSATASSTSVSAGITQLGPGIVYHFRVVAQNKVGTIYGADQTFVTLPAAPPTVSYPSPAASNMSSRTATVYALIGGQAADTTFRFEYGTALIYGSTSPSGSLAGDTAQHQVSVELSGLQSLTTYHFRVIATNADGTTYGADQTFATNAEAAIPAAEHLGVQVIAQSRSGVRDRFMRLEYTFGSLDNDTRTFEILTIGRYKIRTKAHHLDGDVFVKWRVPKNAPARMRFCVQSFELSPYSGVSRDCALVYIS
jgi:hypothetical protein